MDATQTFKEPPGILMTFYHKWKGKSLYFGVPRFNFKLGRECLWKCDNSTYHDRVNSQVVNCWAMRSKQEQHNVPQWVVVEIEQHKDGKKVVFSKSQIFLYFGKAIKRNFNSSIYNDGFRQILLL